MNGVTVSIDRIVIDFTDVYWDFFNEFHKRICHFYGVRMTVGERGFQYRIRINTGEHFLHISYKLVFAPKTRKNTLRIEAYRSLLSTSGIGSNKSETMPIKNCLNKSSPSDAIVGYYYIQFLENKVNLRDLIDKLSDEDDISTASSINEYEDFYSILNEINSNERLLAEISFAKKIKDLFEPFRQIAESQKKQLELY